MSPASKILAVSLGGVAGVNARYWLSVYITNRLGGEFPYATFLINVSGSFLIGLLATLFGRWSAHPYVGLVVIVGFLGGYTTFSSYEFEAYTLLDRRAIIPAVVYMAGSVACGFLAAVFGVHLAHLISRGHQP